MLITRFFIFPLLLVLAVQCSGRTIEEKSPSGAEPVSHDQWDRLLQKHVDENGMVSYKGFQEDGTELEKYLRKLKSNHPDKSWSREERLAYWINAYNAFTVKLVLKHYPVESIKDIGGMISGPWKEDFIKIEGKTYNLHDIEHNILLANYDEPRVHFAINCASISCPVLLNEAYRADDLDEQLDRQARAFINNDLRNEISRDKLVLSEIFKWYEEDFTKEQPLGAYIDQYTDVDLSLYENGEFKGDIGYKDYDWGLNEQGALTR